MPQLLICGQAEWLSHKSLTVHFVNGNFDLKTRRLQTAYFSANHTGENIAMGLRECLSSWGLKEEAQMSITTDNAANMIKAMELNQWTRLQCFGHRLHLATGKCKSVCLLINSYGFNMIMCAYCLQ